MGEEEYFKEESSEEEPIEEESFAERRKGPDKWIKIMKFFAMTCWALFVFSFYLVSEAQPQLESFFERWLNAETEKTTIKPMKSVKKRIETYQIVSYRRQNDELFNRSFGLYLHVLHVLHGK